MLAGPLPKHSRSDHGRWASLVTLDRNWEGGETGLVIPSSISDIRDLVGAEIGHTRLTSEGILLLCHFDRHTRYWKMPTSFDIVKNAVASRKLTAKLNEKGSTACEIIRRLEGLRGVGSIANVELIDLLDSTTRGAVNYEGKVLPTEKCRALLHKIDGHGEWTERKLKRLLSDKVLKLGLKLQCTKCSQNGWHALDELADQILCRRCLQEFDFPTHAPEKQRWAYHTIGPFSTGQYAMGSYSVVLALRYLITHIRAVASWVPGVDLIDEAGRKHDADFLAFWQDTSADPKTEMLIGECKSKGEFDKDDRRRADYFRELFPDAFFVFATLRDNLSLNDRRWLLEFAKTAKVIVLNAAELTSDLPLDLSQNTVDERGFVIEHSQLKNLSDLTRSKYLVNLEEYEVAVLGHA